MAFVALSPELLLLLLPLPALLLPVLLPVLLPFPLLLLTSSSSSLSTPSDDSTFVLLPLPRPGVLPLFPGGPG